LVPEVELPGRDLVLVSLAGVVLEGRHHGILSANRPPGHDGAFHRNSGHNADLLGVRPNRDTVAGNFASNWGFADTTYSTSTHTSYWVLQYRWEDTRNTEPIRIEVRKNYIANPVKTNHRYNRPTAYWARPKAESKDPRSGEDSYSHTEHEQVPTWRRLRLQLAKLPVQE
jgi:hypothetical protein